MGACSRVGQFRTEGRKRLLFAGDRWQTLRMIEETATEPRVPSAETIAFFVRMQRGMLRWKKEMLAVQAGVSLSTLERVERGEPVSIGSLEKLAVALGQDKGAFTQPRVPLGEEEAARRLAESFAWVKDTVPVKVAPLRKERQLREILGTLTAILSSDLDDAEEDLAQLREWLDLASFMSARDGKFFGPRPDRSFRRRDLYRDVFACVQNIERRYKAVCMVGVYKAESNLDGFAEIDVAVVVFRSRENNPAIATYEEMRGPAFIDMKQVLRDWLEADD